MAEPLKYRIEVQGCVEKRWLAWFEGMELVGIDYKVGFSVSTLTGTLTDQAALHGLLRKLYARGFLLLRVICMDPYDESQSNSLSFQVEE